MNHCKECGAVFDQSGRSLPAHRRLFGLIRAAHAQWPESAEFQPRDERQLRAYLLIKAGWTNVKPVEATEECASNAAAMSLFRYTVEGTARAMAGDAGYCEIRVSASGAEIITARSINFQTVSRREFGPISDAIGQIIAETLGVDCETLLREGAKAA